MFSIVRPLMNQAYHNWNPRRVMALFGKTITAVFLLVSLAKMDQVAGNVESG